MKKISLLLPFLILGGFLSLAAQRAVVTGVDTAGILTEGTVDVYVSLPEEEQERLGELGAEEFRLEERKGPGGEWVPRKIEGFRYNGFAQEEISFLLLVDNSGSMYDSLAGRPESDPEKQRMGHLTAALRDLFDKTGDYRDALSLLTFNTYVTEESGFVSDRNALFQSLGNITRPKGDEAFTELYRAMERGVDNLVRRKGRKVLILLTDGEDYSYRENKGEPHPLWGEEAVDREALAERYRKSGVTLYTIFYARREDAALRSLSEKTGGGTYRALTENELTEAYREIHRRISREFRLSYAPGITPGREKSLRVSYGAEPFGPGFSFLWEIFWGLPPGLPWWVFLLLSAAALLGILVLHRTPFERLYPYTHLEVLSPGDHAGTILEISDQRTLLAVGSQKTEILQEEAFRNRAPDEAGITIIKDPREGYVLEAETEVMVNNRPVTKKALKPGDVIRAEGTLIIFDEPGE